MNTKWTDERINQYESLSHLLQAVSSLDTCSGFLKVVSSIMDLARSLRSYEKNSEGEPSFIFFLRDLIAEDLKKQNESESK